MVGRWVHLACLIGFLGSALVSQAQEITPLHTFFQRNYDSTVIYQSGLREQRGPYYLILAKQQNRVDFFTYISPYRETAGRYFPGNLVRHFARKEAEFRAATPDTNQYFLPGMVQSSVLTTCWNQLDTRRLWAIKSDQQAASGASGQCVIDDGDYSTFYLIDRRAIRAASFYAPAYFEECLGKNVNRQQAIHAQNIFRATLRASQEVVR